MLTKAYFCFIILYVADMQISVECRGVAQLGSALVSGTRGREFESRRPDQIENVETRMVMRVFLFLDFARIPKK